MDTVRRFFNGDPASRMKNELDAGDSRSSEGSGPAVRPHREGKGKKPESPLRSAERHPHDSDPFVTCSDRDGRNRWHSNENTGCKVGVPGAGAGGGNDTPPSLEGEDPPAHYRSRESTPGPSPPRSGPRWEDMNIDDHMEFGPDADPLDSAGTPDGGPPGPPGIGPPGGPPGGRPPGGLPYRGPLDRGPPGGQPGGNPPYDPPGADIPENIWQWIVYLKRKICNLEREAQINKIEIGKSTAVAAKAKKELDIANFEAGKLSGVVTKLQRRLDRLEDLRRYRSNRPPSGVGI